MAKQSAPEKAPEKKVAALAGLTPLRSDLTREERKQLGRAARQKTPLEKHSIFEVDEKRDIIANIENSNAGRLTDLIPLRHGRMLVSPFTFFRGSASLMAQDLASSADSGYKVQACGDCHIQNFGVFATPERKLVVDINDFDETLPAPWEWDVKRLAASLVLAATNNGYPIDVGTEAVLNCIQAYREQINAFSNMTLLESWYYHIEANEAIESSASSTRRRKEETLKAELEKSSPEVMREKLTVTSSGRLRFRDNPPLLCHLGTAGTDEQEKQAFADYRESLSEDKRVLLDKFELVDIARKVVGIGSVGTMCGVILLVSSEKDILVLQLKEARQSVLEPYCGASGYQHHGQRVVNGQRLMQAASDMFLGWTTGLKPPYRHFFIRQLRDIKIGANTLLWAKSDFRQMPKLAGRILARAHVRSQDASLLRGYLGKSDEFDQAIAKFAHAYAKQVEKDYAAFSKACKSGRLKVEMID